MLLALVLGTVLGGAQITTLLIVQAAFALLAAIALCSQLRHRGTGEPSDELVAVGVAGLRSVWADPGVRVMSGLLFLGFGAFIALTTWLQALLHHYRISANTAGGLLVAMVLAGAIGAALLPPLLVRRGAERTMIAASVFAVVLGGVLLAFLHAVWLDALVLVPMGLLLLTDLPVILELSERRAGTAAGTVTALLWLSGQLGGLVVALAVQLVVHHPTPAFLLLAVVGLCALPLLSRLGPVLASARAEPANAASGAFAEPAAV